MNASTTRILFPWGHNYGCSMFFSLISVDIQCLSGLLMYERKKLKNHPHKYFNKFSELHRKKRHLRVMPTYETSTTLNCISLVTKLEVLKDFINFFNRDFRLK